MKRKECLNTRLRLAGTWLPSPASGFSFFSSFLFFFFFSSRQTDFSFVSTINAIYRGSHDEFSPFLSSFSSLCISPLIFPFRKENDCGWKKERERKREMEEYPLIQRSVWKRSKEFNFDKRFREESGSSLSFVQRSSSSSVRWMSGMGQVTGSIYNPVTRLIRSVVVSKSR